MKKLLLVLFLFLTFQSFGQFTKPSGAVTIPTYSMFRTAADSGVHIYQGSTNLYNSFWMKFDTVKVKGLATQFDLLSFLQKKDTTQNRYGYIPFYRYQFLMLKNDSSKYYEKLVNKSTSVTTDGASDVKYASSKSVKDYAAPVSVYPATGLTTGYIPYKSATTLVDSPIYTDGTTISIFANTTIGNGTGQANLYLNRSATNTIENAIRWQTGGINDWYLGSGASGGSSNLELYNYGTSSIAFSVNRSNGYTGVGLANAPQLLSLYSSAHTKINIDGLNSGVERSIVLNTNGLADWQFGEGISAAGSDFEVYNHGLGEVNFKIIKSSGNTYLSPYNGFVSIGHLTPSVALDVRKSTSGDWVTKLINTNSTDGYGLYVQGANNASTYLLGLNNGAGYKFIVYGDGKVNINNATTGYDLGVNGTGFFATSLTTPTINLSTGAALNYIWKCTNATTGAGSWQAAAAGEVYRGVVDGDDGKINYGATALIDGTGTSGDYYRCYDPGTYDYGSGNITLAIGDELHYDGAVWRYQIGVGYTLTAMTALAMGGSKLGSGMNIGGEGADLLNILNEDKGDITVSGTGTNYGRQWSIDNDVVTYAKMQNVSATDKVLGRVTAGAGDVEEISTTGSGDVVRATSPILVTPALGTPSSGVATNLTGTATALNIGGNAATATTASATTAAVTFAASGGAAAGTTFNGSTAKTIDYSTVGAQIAGNYVNKESGKHLPDNNFTDADSTKLLGIAAGAEVNVNADWNAVSGDAQILNKPTITSGTVTSVAALTLGTTGTDLSSSVANGTSTPVITLNVPTASASNRGALSAADWSTFNGKQAAGTYSTDIHSNITALNAVSGTNTGDNAVNSNYSGLVTNATHSGDATGSGALTLATVNSNVGTYQGLTINAKGLVTAAANQSYLTSESDPTVNNATLTLAVSGSGLSGSQTFTANQASNATFTVTSNATASNTASTIVLRDGSGNVSLTGTFCTSDSTLKKNIRSFSKVDLYNASKIDFVKFLFKRDSTNHLHFGVVAQDVEKLIPEVVSTNENGKLEVNYTEMLVLIVAQQKEEIKLLKEQNKDFEKRISKLERKNKWSAKQMIIK